MNNNLPPEILHFIFTQLPLRDRIRCTLVCRHWHKALWQRSLLYQVEILHKEGLDKLIDLLQRQPSLGNQVETLKIEPLEGGGIDFDCRKFCNMFPNLRTFLNYNSGRLRKKYFSRPFEITNPDSKLEEIDDCGECELTRQLLVSAHCTHLTGIYVKLSGVENPRDNFFPLLDGLPALVSFGVSGCDFGILDCEIIHDNIPSIRYLLIEYLCIKIDPMPANITSATSVSGLKLVLDDFDDDVDCHIRWYEYLSKKYTNLSKFIFDDDVLLGDDGVGFSRKIYQGGIIPIFKNMGSRLENLGVNHAPDDIGFFEKLDDFGCKIQSADFQYNDGDSIFSQLTQSNQSKCVKEVSLFHTDIPSPSLLVNMTSLQSIDIGLTNGLSHSTNLTEYMNAFPPSLKEFNMKCSHLEFSDIPTNINNIETLTIKCPTLPTMLDKAISACCPKLTRITIEGGIAGSMTIQLPNNRLETLDIKSYHTHEERKLGFLLKYTNGSHTLCFVERPDSLHACHPRLEFGQIKQLKGRTTIEIECASTNYLCFKVYEKDYAIY